MSAANCLVCGHPLFEVHLHQHCVKDPGFHPEPERAPAASTSAPATVAEPRAWKVLGVLAAQVSFVADDATAARMVAAAGAERAEAARAFVIEQERARAEQVRITLDLGDGFRATYVRDRPSAEELAARDARRIEREARWAAWLDAGGRAFLDSWEPLPVEPDLSTSMWLVPNPDYAWWSTGPTPGDAVRAANEWFLETYRDPERAADASDEHPPEDPRMLLLDGERAPLLRVFGPADEIRALAKFLRG